MIRKGFVWCLVFVFLHVTIYAQEMVFSAQVSSQKIGTKDQLQITYTLTNAPQAGNFQPPSFSGFVIEGGPYQSNSNSISDVNGQVRQTSSVNLTYVLRPSKAGVVTISPAKVDIGGKIYTSNSITVQVVNGSIAQERGRGRNQNNPFDDPFFDDPFAALRQQQQQRLRQRQQQQRGQQQQNAEMQSLGEKDIHKNIFIKVEVDKTNPYLGEQITASYKLYTRLPMSVNLTQLPSLNGFWSQDFQIPNPPKGKEEIVNGQRYQVFLLKKSALFPQQDGNLELDPAKAEGVVRVLQQVKSRNPYADDPFFGSLFMDDPFFNEDMFSGYNYKDVQVKLSSQPVKINVRQLPAADQPASFTGAVGNFSVNATLDKTSLSTDDAATFTFSISGSGNLKLIGNPKVVFPPELGIYDPVVTDTITGRNPAITGSKLFMYTLSPQAPGDYVIPAIPFSYYDAASGTYKTVQSQPVTVHVVKGKNYTGSVAKHKGLPGDIHDIEQQKISSGSGTLLFAKAGYWSLYAVALLAFSGLLLWKRRKEEYEGNAALFRNKKANKVAWKRLATARKLLPQQQHKAFYEEVSKAIWLYLSDKLGIPLSNLSKENVAMELTAKSVPLACIDRVKRLVLECEMALYSPSGGQQQRQHTLDEATNTISELETVLKKNNILQHAG